MTPIEKFTCLLGEKGYSLDFCSPLSREIGKHADKTFYILAIAGHGQSALYLLEEAANGSFELWELHETPLSIVSTMVTIERRLPPHTVPSGLPQIVGDMA